VYALITIACSKSSRKMVALGHQMNLMVAEKSNMTVQHSFSVRNKSPLLSANHLEKWSHLGIIRI
jgi:hypothetical protein